MSEGTPDSERLDPGDLDEIYADLADEDRWRVTGEINNRLVSKYDPDFLMEWFRTPNPDLDGRTPESVVPEGFDPADPMVKKLLEVVRALDEAAPRSTAADPPD